jgi:nicotinamide mononucleotide adenylyltransferase
MRPRVYILPGRHQPPHNDHAAIIRRALELIDGDLFLALITRDPAASLFAVSELDREAQQQHAPERTPYSFRERHEFIRALLTPAENARVHVIPLPQPETSWGYITAVFPEPRTWIVPAIGERFDDLKAAFFRECGDEILRVTITATTDGRRVRALAERGDPELARHVPPAVYRAITKNKGEI